MKTHFSRARAATCANKIPLLPLLPPRSSSYHYNNTNNTQKARCSRGGAPRARARTRAGLGAKGRRLLHKKRAAAEKAPLTCFL